MEIKERKAHVNISISKRLYEDILAGKAHAETPFEYMIMEQIQKASNPKLILNSIYGVTCKTLDEDCVKRLEEEMSKGISPIIYADTDSTKVELVSEPSSDVSRETLWMDKQDAEILIDIARKIDVECGQVACSECLMHTDKERYQTNCLLSQLNYVRRKYSDREE